MICTLTGCIDLPTATSHPSVRSGREGRVRPLTSELRTTYNVRNKPPSTGISAPVTYEAASEHR
jgi:hypothetical protein